MSEKFAVEVKDLKEEFKDHLAVNEISFNIKEGEVFAILGPNGAGKSTTLKMITTLLKPTSGSIKIFGKDVEANTKLVRSFFGFTSQDSSIDENLSARENLMIFARLNGLNRKDARTRTNELLAEFDLINSADKTLNTYSGGMKRRLDLAVSLISKPKIIFLDEPTTGLDPRTRQQMWEVINDLVENGSTIILTTQYLEEADQLANRIAMIDHGEIVGTGSPTELKAMINSINLDLTFDNTNDAREAEKIISKVANSTNKEEALIKSDVNSSKDIQEIIGILNERNISIADININKPTLDDVFFSITEGKKLNKG
ncbi:Daunorubicin resistance ATP-binding protein drrA [Apilactobacillus kunkeei]|uniref:ABC transporter ATP-binding protein n=1 Tax=Apilactobacillus kunkeei TaxID=148814 RepID=UPI0006C58D93|nr:ATP-binding cassette domain-containing protein [Apilactobacillus kunkeei]KOY72820.1 Daunorubicin resistance ATP-binding protein drrA [Apilactobacillus kunkeei]